MFTISPVSTSSSLTLLSLIAFLKISSIHLSFLQNRVAGGVIRVGSIVRAAPGVSRGVLSNGARGRVIEDDGTSRPYKVQALQGSDTNWFRADEVNLADTPAVVCTWFFHVSRRYTIFVIPARFYFQDTTSLPPAEVMFRPHNDRRGSCQLPLRWRQTAYVDGQFNCDVCGSDGAFPAYHCDTCEFDGHRDCVLLRSTPVRS